MFVRQQRADILIIGKIRIAKEKPKQIQEVGLGHSLEIKSNEGSEIEADDL